MTYDFLWEGKPRPISDLNNCLPKDKGGLGMIHLIDFIRCKHLKWMYDIRKKTIEPWNAKYWLQCQDKHYQITYSVLTWSSWLYLANVHIPKFYRKCLESWYYFKQKYVPMVKKWFLSVNDILDCNTNNVVNTKQIFIQLEKKNNWISEYQIIKTFIPKSFKICCMLIKKLEMMQIVKYDR